MKVAQELSVILVPVIFLTVITTIIVRILSGVTLY